VRPTINRRLFIAWTGAAVASAPIISACAKNSNVQGTTELPDAGAAMQEPIKLATPSGTFVKNGKEYPYKDPATGKLLYHDPISFAPPPSLRRRPLTKPVNLLEHQPSRVESQNGILDVDLKIAYANVVVDGQAMKLRTYNGGFPGPTLVAKPGDILRIREQNSLPPDSPEPTTAMHNMNEPHGFNIVNLHTHGLNVSPEDTEDNVLIEIHPGQTFAHNIHIPADHPTGTFWYHPHKHGSTGCQVGSGMAGMLLLTDPNNDIRSVPEVGAAKEVILVFQELYIKTQPNGAGEVPGMPAPVDGYYYYSSETGPVVRNELTVNGVACTEHGMNDSVIVPELHMRPGEVQHWRMVHGGIFHNWPFAIEGHSINIIAYDGLTLEKPEAVSDFLFVPGQRRDVLVQASMTPGTYAVKRKQYKQAEQVNTWPEITLFNLVIDGRPAAMKLPMTLNPARERLPHVRDEEIAYKRDVAFAFVDDTANDKFYFTIDDRVFDPGDINATLILGTAEEWTVTNNPSSDHPFHIHVNWFELLQSVDGLGKVTTYDPPIWMDTVNIPTKGRVIIRMRAQNFQGKSVFHCHFLTHEDEGMMALIEIVDGSPKTATITPTGDTLVSNDYNNRVQIRFLPGSVTNDTEVTYQYLTSPNVTAANPTATASLAPLLPKNAADYNMFFKLGAHQGGKALAELDRPATIEVKYSPQQVNPDLIDKVDKASVQLYFYDDSRKAWSADSISLIERKDNLLTCSTTKLGTFAVTGKIINV
jgi:FtsP/CotA-like multicopper oxidase with cupredoxin domain